MPRNFLVSFHPLCETEHGREALKRHKDLVPFSDGSCRREPDLQAKNPSITALCRGGNFAPKLKVGDRVFYMTVKGRYLGRPHGWGLVAALEVIHVCDTHEAAAEWYRAAGQPLPSNCMVKDNPPLPLDNTAGLPSLGKGMRQSWTQNAKPPQSLEEWDAHYAGRAARWPKFVITEPIRPVELKEPRIVTRAAFKHILKKDGVPGTQNFKKLSYKQFFRLLATFAPA